MKDYFILENSFLLTIFIPIQLIIVRTTMTLRNYLCDEKKLNIFNWLIRFFAVFSGIAFYYLEFGKYFTFVWITLIILGSFIIKICGSNEDLGGDSYNFVEKILTIGDIGLGIFFILLPHTYIFVLIGGGYYKKIDMLSIVIYTILGLTYIFGGKQFAYLTIKKLIRIKNKLFREKICLKVILIS